MRSSSRLPRNPVAGFRDLPHTSQGHLQRRRGARRQRRKIVQKTKEPFSTLANFEQQPALPYMLPPRVIFCAHNFGSRARKPPAVAHETETPRSFFRFPSLEILLLAD